MDQAAISTIHSFCQRVIQDHALPGLQYFESEILADDSDLWQQAIKDWWRCHSYSLHATEWLLFNKAIHNFESFTRQINEIRKKASASFLPEKNQPLSELYATIYSFEPALRELAIQWNSFKQPVMNIIRSSKALSRSIKLPYHRNNVEAFFENVDNYFGSDCLLPVADEICYLSTAVLHHHSTPSKRGSDTNLEHEFFRGVASIVDKLNRLVATIRSTALQQAYKDCRAQVLCHKKANQKLSYQDLIDFIQQALHSATGSQLASIIRKQFPVAMIDEFQDTDHAQFSIFSRVYFKRNDISLTLIGDPKQAIYSFRGGDIFTYMLARQAANIQHCVLKTNWRSQPGLVYAVNHFFSSRKDPFIYSDSIQFLPAGAAEINASSFLEIDSQAQTSLTLWQIPHGSDNKPLSKQKAGDMINSAVTAEVVSLLRAGQHNRASINGRTLSAGDIAILVRTSSQGEAIRKTLEASGVAAIAIGRDKVFNSQEAMGLSLLLNAIAHPGNRSKMRQSLASQLLNFDHQHMIEISGNELSWQNWIERFRQLNHIWLSRGFIPMFQHMMQAFKLAEKLAVRDQAERRLTNLLHLGELLQQQSLTSNGIDNLLNWFHHQRQNNTSEEAELRLESDQSLVKIITIHKSKGLEFPVVFLPYLWDCYAITANQDQPVYFHNEALRAVIDLGSENIDRHRLGADKERLAEDIRLLYVALTRARSKVYLAWGEAGLRGRSGNSSQTAMAYLLHSKQTPEQLNLTAASGIPAPLALPEELQSFACNAAGEIEILCLPTSRPDSKVIGKSQTTADIQAREYDAVMQHSWRISSFSSLTRDIHQPSAASDRDPRGDAILNFPAGSHVGLFLHAVFEHLDFNADIDSQCAELLRRYAPKFGLELDDRIPQVCHWVQQVVETTLIQPGLKLSVLSNQQRLNELTFDFALDHADIAGINQFFADRQNPPANVIAAQDFRGIVTGVIDLVFEYDGKYYLADYKSNYLGNSLADYSQENLQQAMLDRRYDLQLLLYSIALHRYLRQRIKDYSYQLHFGGAYYLFLRAMRKNNASDFGVYFECPTQADIEALDALLNYHNAIVQK